MGGAQYLTYIKEERACVMIVVKGVQRAISSASYNGSLSALALTVCGWFSVCGRMHFHLGGVPNIAGVTTGTKVFTHLIQLEVFELLIFCVCIISLL